MKSELRRLFPLWTLESNRHTENALSREGKLHGMSLKEKPTPQLVARKSVHNVNENDKLKLT